MNTWYELRKLDRKLGAHDHFMTTLHDRSVPVLIPGQCFYLFSEKEPEENRIANLDANWTRPKEAKVAQEITH